MKQTTFAFKVINDDLDGDLLQSVHDFDSVLMFEGGDDYTSLKARMDRLLVEVAKAKQDGIEVEGHTYPVEFTLGGDLAFLNAVMGLSSCSHTYPCVWCKKHIGTFHEFDTPAPPRTVADMLNLSHQFDSFPGQCQKCADPFADKKAVKEAIPTTERARLDSQKEHDGSFPGRPPLFGSLVEVVDIVPDILHLMLRIVDTLFHRTIKSNMLKEHEEPLILVLRETVKCSIKTEKIKAQSKSGDSSQAITKATFIGRECEKLVGAIDTVLKCIFDEETDVYADIKDCWQKWEELWELLSSPLPRNDVRVGNKPVTYPKNETDARELRASQIESAAAEFIDSFGLADDDSHCTLYFHILIEHIPQAIRRHGDLRKYSTSGLEHLHSFKKRDKNMINGRTVSNKEGRGKKMTLGRVWQAMKAEYVRKVANRLRPSGLSQWAKQLARKARRGLMF